MARVTCGGLVLPQCAPVTSRLTCVCVCVCVCLYLSACLCVYAAGWVQDQARQVLKLLRDWFPRDPDFWLFCSEVRSLCTQLHTCCACASEQAIEHVLGHRTRNCTRLLTCLPRLLQSPCYVSVPALMNRRNGLCQTARCSRDCTSTLIFQPTTIRCKPWCKGYRSLSFSSSTRRYGKNVDCTPQFISLCSQNASVSTVAQWQHKYCFGFFMLSYACHRSLT